MFRLVFFGTLLLFSTLVTATPFLRSSLRAEEECEFIYDPSADNGPPNWGTFKDEWKTCGDGTKQSPIDVPCEATFDSFSKNPDVFLKETELKFEFTNPVNWELLCENVGQCGYTKFMGTRFDFVNLHFHSPSEHKLDGKQFPLEAHKVHRSSQGELLVIATFFEFRDDFLTCLNEKVGLESEENEVLASILDNIDAEEETFDVDVPGLIGDEGYCTYSGSLTTPPCTEGVTWLLALEKQKVTSAQIAEYVQSTGSGQFGNNRPIQPLNNREITCFLLGNRGGDDDDDDDDRRR